MPREWPRSTLGVLRIVIIILAGFLIWQFSDGYRLAWETLAERTDARWFNVLSALCEGVLGPVLALSAIALSVTNRRLLLATILAILAGSYTSRHSPRSLSESWSMDSKTSQLQL
jgi:ABC-type anion transport system duplicated permease subunit